MNYPVGDNLAQHIAKYFVGLALQDTTGFPDYNLTVHNAVISVDLVYKVMDATSIGPVNARAVMTPALKSQILMFAGEQRDHSLFHYACTFHNRFDSAPDQQLFVPWLEDLTKRRSLMNFWSPYLQEWSVPQSHTQPSTASSGLANTQPKQLDAGHPFIPEFA